MKLDNDGVFTQSEYETEILSRLIEKYERSAGFREGSSTRRILLVMDKEPKLCKTLEDPDNNRCFAASLRDLEDKGLVGFQWVRYEKNNLVDRIWLITEPQALEKTYQMLGRRPQIKILDELQAMISETIDHLQGREAAGISGIIDFLVDCREVLTNKKRIPAPFLDDIQSDRDLLKFVEGLDSVSDDGGEIMERIMSSRLYGDSKYYEKNVKSKALALLRSVYKSSMGSTSEQDGVSCDELMQQYGITRWPEILQFTGNIRVKLDGDHPVDDKLIGDHLVDGHSVDGQLIDYSSQQFGAYMNSLTLRHVTAVEVFETKRLIFIENLANYIWYVSTKRKSDEVVIWHGGFLSPVREKWFRMLCEAGEKLKIFHWSDIDLGGFRIFAMLREKVAQSVMPMKMDVATLKQYSDRTIPIGDDSADTGKSSQADSGRSDQYLASLSKLMDDPEYEVFHDVIKYMLENHVKLEQEQETLCCS